MDASPRADPRWEAIVEQLRATRSDSESYEAPPQREHAWARRLGIHINRAPKR